MTSLPISPTPAGVRLRLRIQPRASREEVAGVSGDTIRIRLTAPSTGGAANEALVRFLSDRLRVPRSAIELVAGKAGRTKLVAVSGISAAEAAARLGV